MAQPVIGLKSAVREALRMKSGLFGFGMLIFLLAVVVAIPLIAPYDVVSAWGNPGAWTDLPRNAAPDWIDAFSEEKLSRNVQIGWGGFRNVNSTEHPQFKLIQLRARWTFEYDTFPTEIRLQTLADWANQRPQVTVVWQRPDGQDVILHRAAPERKAPFVEVLPLSTKESIRQSVLTWANGTNGAPLTEIDRVFPHVSLYAQAGPDMLDPVKAEVLKGRYSIFIEVIAFNPADTLDARFTSYGEVYGFAGTDHLRRDLLIGLIWGAPIALAFGAAAAFLTVMSQVILGALGAYYGGRFDEVIQRATDFVIIIPALPVLILIAYLFSPSIIIVLLIVVVFNIVGGTTKVVRSIALQVKEEMYIESARSYGAKRGRILFRYVLPRIMPYTFALLALSVPGFIFLEAALSFIGLGDPILPTWGAIMGEASRNGAAYNGLWWWIAFPALGIVFTTVAFAFLGYSFDKVLNPRLREE